MELSWLMKLRIAAAAAIGVLLIGIIAWPSQSSLDPFGSMLFKQIGTNGEVTLLIMAFLAGLISYFVAWPYGREIAILAVPSGLCVWAIKAGSTGAIMQFNPTAEQRLSVLSQLRWESVFWLFVVGCGFAGVLLAQNIASRLKKSKTIDKIEYTPTKFINSTISLLLSAVIVIICIKLFARDVGVLDGRLDNTAAQPALGQIIFAVLLSFGIASFVVKLLLNTNYIWPAISCIFITFYGISSYMNPDVLENYVTHKPAIFFPNAIVSILPIQMVTFGILGSIAGYWMAIRYQYWKKHEM